MDRSSGTTDIGEYVGLLTVANKSHALLLFLAMISEKYYLAFPSSKL